MIIVPTTPMQTRQASLPTGMVDPRFGVFLLTLATNDGFYLSSFRIKICEMYMYCFLYVAVLTGTKFDVSRAYDQKMYDGYVNKHRPQHHCPGNDKNLNKNKRFQIRYQAFITSVCVCVHDILSDCYSCSSHIILTDYTLWFLIIVLLTTWILRAMHV